MTPKEAVPVKNLASLKLGISTVYDPLQNLKDFFSLLEMRFSIIYVCVCMCVVRVSFVLKKLKAESMKR